MCASCSVVYGVICCVQWLSPFLCWIGSFYMHQFLLMSGIFWSFFAGFPPLFVILLVNTIRLYRYYHSAVVVSLLLLLLCFFIMCRKWIWVDFYIFFNLLKQLLFMCVTGYQPFGVASASGTWRRYTCCHIWNHCCNGDGMQFSPLRHHLLQPLEGQGQIEVMLKFVLLDYLLVLCKQHFVVAVVLFFAFFFILH